MKKVLIPSGYQKLLAPVFQKHGVHVVTAPNGKVKAALQKVTDVNGIVLGTDQINLDLMKQLPHLKIIARAGVGYDNVDLAGAKQQKVWVTNTPGANATAVAENTVADLLILSKHLYSTSNQMRGGRSLANYPSRLLRGKTIGIVGFGHIAHQVVKMLSGLGVRILIWDRHPKSSRYGKFVDWQTLIENSDYVSLHIPATPQTEHCINAKTFKMMKKSAFIVNFGRGTLIDQAALVKALKDHEIAGAGLDVFEREPLPLNSQLRQLPNVFLTPHCAGATVESHREMGMCAAKNILQVLSNQRPVTPVNEI